MFFEEYYGPLHERLDPPRTNVQLHIYSRSKTLHGILELLQFVLQVPTLPIFIFGFGKRKDMGVATHYQISFPDLPADVGPPYLATKKYGV